MFREERLRELVDLLAENGQIRVPDAASYFDVSESTIRLDLKELEGRGLILRTHGGALLQGPPEGRPTFEMQKAFPERLEENIAQKRAIGRATAALIEDGEIIMIDGGSTTRQVCRNLNECRSLIMVTNVANTYPDLIANENIRVVLTGGELEHESMTLLGEPTQLTLAKYRASKAILGIDAVSVEFGLTTLDAQAAALKKCMIEHSDKLILVADSSKINKVSLMPVGPIDLVDVLVTDDGINPEAHADIEALGIDVIAAPVTD